MGGVEDRFAQVAHGCLADMVAQPVHPGDFGGRQLSAGYQPFDPVHGDELADVAPVDGEAVTVQVVAQREAAVRPVGEEAAEAEEEGGGQIRPQHRQVDRLGEAAPDQQAGKGEAPRGKRAPY